MVGRAATLLIGAVLLLASAESRAQGADYVFEAETIRGTIEKPEAFYILSPSSLEYESMDSEESFLPALYETVEEAPF